MGQHDFSQLQDRQDYTNLSRTAKCDTFSWITTQRQYASSDPYTLHPSSYLLRSKIHGKLVIDSCWGRKLFHRYPPEEHWSLASSRQFDSYVYPTRFSNQFYNYRGTLSSTTHQRSTSQEVSLDRAFYPRHGTLAKVPSWLYFTRRTWGLAVVFRRRSRVWFDNEIPGWTSVQDYVSCWLGICRSSRVCWLSQFHRSDKWWLCHCFGVFVSPLCIY